MARQPTLTVNVNAQQFQQFAQQFQQFSQQINQLNRQFARINQSLTRSNVLIRAMNATLSGVSTALSKISSTVGQITKKFLGWSVVIGGVSALLGAGGSLYGIERLANSIMAKRRQALGLNQDYGRTQAANILNRGMMSNPEDTVRNIRLGQAGQSEQLTALLGMGINPFSAEGARMSPDQIMDKIIAKLPDLLNRAGPGKELMMAKAFKLDQIFSQDDLLRFSKKENVDEHLLRAKKKEEYADKLKISARAQLAWTEFSLQLQYVSAQLQSTFGEKLADLAGPLKRLSDSIAHLFRIIMNSPEVQKVIQKLAEWIDKLATEIKKLTQDDIDKFVKAVKEWVPSLEQFKTAMEGFTKILQKAVDLYKLLFTDDPSNFGLRLRKIWGGQLTKEEQERLDPTPPEPNKGVPGSPGAAKPAFPGPGAPPAPGAPGAPDSAPAAPAAPPTSVPTIPPAMAPFMPGANPSFPGPRAAPVPGAAPAAPAAPALPPTQAPSSNPPAAPVQPDSTPSAPSGAPTPTPGDLSPSAITGAIQQFAPAVTTSGPHGTSSRLGNPNLFQPGARGGSKRLPLPALPPIDPSIPQGFVPLPPGKSFQERGSEQRSEQGNGIGPLSMDNWQMNRTANLVVRNVPGSNIFMSATGMTG